MLRNEKKKKQFGKELGERVKHYRELRGLTLADMENITGYTAPYMSYIERGENTPSAYVVWLIAKTLNISMDKICPNAKRDENINNKADPIIYQKDFQEYLKLAKEAYIKRINSKILDQSIRILNEK